MGLLSSIFGGGGSSSDAAATTTTDVQVSPVTNVNNDIQTNIDFTQAGQFISGSLDGFTEQVGQTGGAIGESLSKLGKTAAALGLIALIGWSLNG